MSTCFHFTYLFDLKKDYKNMLRSQWGNCTSSIVKSLCFMILLTENIFPLKGSSFEELNCILPFKTMFPLYRLAFHNVVFSYRIGLLFPLTTNNSAWFSQQLDFTTQRFQKLYKTYRIAFYNRMKNITL